ncbi:folate-binding protein [Lysobacter sp. UC]|uniref:Folate-binding protein n=2 Tax=Lysobacter arvi TaxID=3038776 RepID=A0ABU1C8X0_9GAMM|nr:folate-binding protein [Lysobacter arvi]MDR0181633.1 folate-binding protein [Lysobacter arvi]
MADTLFALPGHALIALEGRDAAAFAQAQFMNDVALLEPGQWQWNGWLTPKGRVIALLALLKRSDDMLWLLLPDADAVAFAAALQRFVFRSKVRIQVREDLHACGRFAAPANASGATFAGGEDTGIELDIGSPGALRTLRLSPTPGRQDEAAAARWHALDLEHGLPRLPASQVEQWTPQQLSLDRLRAFSVKKGCYPGQEIVARTHFLGQAKRGLVLLESDAALEAGRDVTAGAVAMGKLVAAGFDGAKHLALAVMPLEREAVELEVDGTPVVERPIRDGLSR